MKISLLSVPEFSYLGWFTTPEAIQQLKQSLGRHGVEFENRPIEDAEEIHTLENSPETVYWPNSYSIRQGSQIVGLIDKLDEHNLKYVGSGQSALERMINKGRCQASLKKAGVPVPEFVHLDPNSTSPDANLFSITYPVIVKPASQAGSRGISAEAIHESGESALAYAKRIGDEFQDSVIVEEYLPGEEMTVCVLRNGTKKRTISTQLEVKNKGKYTIFDREERIKGCGRTGNTRLYATEPHLQKKLDLLAQKVYDGLGIQDITRFDCRLDGRGVPKVFDVNGMPGLNMTTSSTTQQVLSIHPEMSQEEAYDRLINSIVYSALSRHDVTIPDNIRKETLYSA